jgi:hypothetical protein
MWIHREPETERSIIIIIPHTRETGCGLDRNLLNRILEGLTRQSRIQMDRILL